MSLLRKNTPLLMVSNIQAITKMEADFEQEKQKGTSGLTSGELSVEFMELDLSSLKSTQKFIEEFKASGKPLHVLICNAGLGMHPLSMYICQSQLLWSFRKRSLQERPEKSCLTTTFTDALDFYFKCMTISVTLIK